MAIRRIPLNTIQRELYKRLKENLDVEIYNNVPEEASAPFVQIGLFTLKRADTKTNIVNEITCTINIFSEAEGTQEVNDIAEKVVAAIETAPFDLGEGFSIIDGDLDYFECITEGQFGYVAEITYMLTIQQH